MNELLTRMSVTLDALRTELHYAEHWGDAAWAASARAEYDAALCERDDALIKAYRGALFPK